MFSQLNNIFQQSGTAQQPFMQNTLASTAAQSSYYASLINTPGFMNLLNNQQAASNKLQLTGQANQLGISAVSPLTSNNNSLSSSSSSSSSSS